MVLNTDYVGYFLLIVDLTLIKCGLLNLDFFIKNLQFFISLNELSTKDISLINNHLIVLPLLLLLLLCLCDDILKPGNVTFLGPNHLLAGVYLLADLLNVALEFGVLSRVTLLRVSLCGYGVVFHKDLILELGDLLGHSSELHFQFCDLILGFQ